jgi:uncharacterized protein
MSESIISTNRGRALSLAENAKPRTPAVHSFKSDTGYHVLVVNGSRIYDLNQEVFSRVQTLEQSNDTTKIEQLMSELGVLAPPFVDDKALESPPLRAISLAIAQKCNLGCTYCYAQEGSFGGPAKNMTSEVARLSIDRLMESAKPNEKVNIAFLGGEPLANRAVLRDATQYAVEQAALRGAIATFSITTNGTLITAEDGAFFEEHGFAVTVSIDGIRSAHNLLRPFKSGRSSYDAVLERVRPLLQSQRKMQVSARVTVTPRNPMLRDALDELIGLGFHSVGFSPMLHSPTGRDELDGQQLMSVLDAMIECGEEFERRLLRGERYPFSNLVVALGEIHRGTHRPYPCGAGAGYMGVSAEGELAACHRFVGDEKGAMGNVTTGINREQQNQWLAERHVHKQEPCHRCWARYLCSGGCHHEVLGRGRPACDYIRGWLEYCLHKYVRLLELRPSWFNGE